jgi:hypothetical protein
VLDGAADLIFRVYLVLKSSSIRSSKRIKKISKKTGAVIKYTCRAFIEIFEHRV